MKALVKREPARGLWMMDVPKPVPGPHDVLVKVVTASICGTDLHIWKWDAWAQKTVPVGTTIGHEFCGIVEEVGSLVTTVRPGMRVSAEGHITCMTCPLCQSDKRHLCPETEVIGIHRNGAFAEYLVVPECNVFLIPDFIDAKIASIFDPFGNAVHTAFSAPIENKSVLITGAGPIGVMAAAVAKAAGASTVVVTDINEYRLNLARTMGADLVINVDETTIADALTKAGIPARFDIGLEMSGVPNALSDLLEYTTNGGHIALLGILPQQTLIDWDKVIFKMLTLKGIYGREIFRTWHQMTDLLRGGLDLTPVITHQLPFDDFALGFDAMFSGDSGKVVLTL